MVAKFKHYSPEKNSEQILQCVRSSNLHFQVQETPFSIYITVRKKFINEDVKLQADENIIKPEIVQGELSRMKETIDTLVRDKKELRDIIEQKEREVESCAKNVSDLTIQLKHTQIEASEAIEALINCNETVK